MNASRSPLDTVFDSLANDRRRYVLYRLAEPKEESVLELEEFADRVETREREWDESV